MLGSSWSLTCQRSAADLAELVRALPRWDPWRDGFFDGTRLVAERYPLVVSDQGFRFVVPSSKQIWFVCRGTFHPAVNGTRVELSVSPLWNFVWVLSLVFAPFAAVMIWGFWPIDPRLALGVPVGCVALLALIFGFGIWWNTRWVRRRVTETIDRLTGGPSHAPAALDAAPDREGGSVP